MAQLRAARTAQGARLARGEYVRAHNAYHLAWACRAVLDSPPDKPEQLARWVLLKLRDTFAEWRARDEKHNEQKTAPVIAKLMRSSEPVDELEAARDWLAEHPEVKREIEAVAEQKFAGFPKSPAMLRRHAEWLDEDLVARWRAAGSPIVEAQGAARVGTGT